MQMLQGRYEGDAMRGCHRTVTTSYWRRDMTVVEFDDAADAGALMQNVQGRVRPGASETRGE